MISLLKAQDAIVLANSFKMIKNKFRESKLIQKKWSLWIKRRFQWIKILLEKHQHKGLQAQNNLLKAKSEQNLLKRQESLHSVLQNSLQYKLDNKNQSILSERSIINFELLKNRLEQLNHLQRQNNQNETTMMILKNSFIKLSQSINKRLWMFNHKSKLKSINRWSKMKSFMFQLKKDLLLFKLKENHLK